MHMLKLHFVDVATPVATHAVPAGTVIGASGAVVPCTSCVHVRSADTGFPPTKRTSNDHSMLVVGARDTILAGRRAIPVAISMAESRSRW